MHLFYLFLQNIKQIADKLRRQRNLMYNVRLELASDIYFVGLYFLQIYIQQRHNICYLCLCIQLEKNKLGYCECGKDYF